MPHSSAVALVGRFRDRHRLRARNRVAVMLAVLLVVALGAHSLLASQQAATVAPTARTPPVTLAAVPLTGTTVVAQTQAATSALVPLLAATSTLSLARTNAQAWDVRIAVIGATGISGGEALVVAFLGAAAPAMTVAAGTTFPQVSAAAALGAGGLGLTVATLSLVAGCHSCTVHVELRIAPAGSAQPAMVYGYTITTGL